MLQWIQQNIIPISIGIVTGVLLVVGIEEVTNRRIKGLAFSPNKRLFGKGFNLF